MRLRVSQRYPIGLEAELWLQTYSGLLYSTAPPFPRAPEALSAVEEKG